MQDKILRVADFADVLWFVQTCRVYKSPKIEYVKPQLGARLPILVNAKALHEAAVLWEATGMTIPEAAQRATAVLNQAGIPTLIAGGLAVQVHGYPRFTVDADIVVPDIVAAHRVLVERGYNASMTAPIGVVDPQSKVRIDLLPGGSCLTPRCPVNFPMPTELALVYISLPGLISVKLGSFISNPIRRAKDRADVIELIVRNDLRRDFAGIDGAVQGLYRETWDAIQAEPEGPPS